MLAVLACNNVQIYIHGALRSGCATMHNATIQKTTFFELGVYKYQTITANHRKQLFGVGALKSLMAASLQFSKGVKQDDFNRYCRHFFFEDSFKFEFRLTLSLQRRKPPFL